MMVPLCLFLCLATLSQARSIAPSVADPNQVPVSDTRFDDGAVNFGSGMPLPGFTPGIGPQYGSLGGPIGYGGQPAFGGPTEYGGRFGGFGTKYGRGFGGYGGRFGPYGDFEDLFDDQNADDYPFGADLEEEEDDHLTSTSARLEKYLQKQWQLGKRKLQVQVDFGNVPLEWEYLNQYHGVRHPLSMTAFGPKYGLAGPPAPMFDYGFGPTGPIGGFGGPGYGYGGPGYGPGYGPGAPPAPGYGSSQGSGYGQPAQQQQQHPDQGQQTPPAPAQQSAQTQ